LHRRQFAAAFHSPRLVGCAVQPWNALDEANRAVIVVPGNQAKDFEVNHGWDTNHERVILSSMQCSCLSVQDIRHMALGIAGQVGEQRVHEIPHLIPYK
jgi:hypothetical protein